MQSFKNPVGSTQVRYEGGNYNPELIKLAPYQTVAIDIRELRDAQRKDIRGGVMPNDVTSGQVIWYEREKGSLIGRAEIFNVGVGVADSFSCQGNCPCPSSFSSTFMSPTTFSSLIGDSGLIFRPQEMDSDCHSNSFGPFDVTNSVTLWSSTATSVATVDSGGTIICVGAGSTNILATFSATVFGGPPGSCNATTVHPTASGPLNVRPRIGIGILTFNPNPIRANDADQTSATVNVSASPADANPNGLHSGDFVVVEIIKDTPGGTFTYTHGQGIQGQTQNVDLALGNSVAVTFKIVAVTGTPARMYQFTMRVSDVRRPDGQGGSTSILANVLLDPGSGGNNAMLTVNNP